MEPTLQNMINKLLIQLYGTQLRSMDGGYLVRGGIIRFISFARGVNPKIPPLQDFSINGQIVGSYQFNNQKVHVQNNIPLDEVDFTSENLKVFLGPRVYNPKDNSWIYDNVCTVRLLDFDTVNNSLKAIILRDKINSSQTELTIQF